MAFLPISKQDMEERGLYYLDFIFVTGDAYIDHPSFGTAILSRLLESKGYTVGIIAQPNIHNDDDFTRFGRPKLGFLVNAGAIDSMVAHYTVSKKLRHDDAYTPGNVHGKRPDRAVTVYTKILKRLYPDSFVCIGGLEASLRRFAHYDYWKDTVMPSVLIDSGADILSFGMGENSTLEVANCLKHKKFPKDVRGICYVSDTSDIKDAVILPSYEAVSNDKTAYADATREQFENQDEVSGKPLVQQHGDKYVVQNRLAVTLTQEQLDAVYKLPFERYYHPVYEKDGGVPAIQEVEFTVNQNRGCFGACNFCAIAFHQGRRVVSRSVDSVVEEATLLTKSPHFKGYIHDIGGPTANFTAPSCDKQLKCGMCKDKKCLAPTPCKQLKVNHQKYVDMLRRVRQIDKVKKVFVRSGIRYDYAVLDSDRTFIKELVNHHISGQLRVAPEHCSNKVLDMMGKPHIETYERFIELFEKENQKSGKNQYAVPYLMSSHPGSTLKDAVDLAVYLKRHKIFPKQVQDFYPTPGTVSTCMFYTGLDPYTMKEVYVPRTTEEKAMQRALLQFFIPENKELCIKALKKANRYDLIGYGKNCLVTLIRNKRYGEEKWTTNKGKQRKNAKRR